MKKALLLLALFVVTTMQAQQSPVPVTKWVWAKPSNGSSQGCSILPNNGTVTVSYTIDNDIIDSVIGGTDTRLSNLDPLTGSTTSGVVTAGSGNDFSYAKLSAAHDTLYHNVLTYNGNLSSIPGLGNVPFGSYQQPYVLQMVNGEMTNYFIPTTESGGLSLHSVLPYGDNVWTVCGRPRLSTVVNGTPVPNDLHSICVTRLSNELYPEQTWFYGNGANEAGIDTSENPESYRITADGSHLVITGWIAPAQGGAWDPRGCVWFINLLNGACRQVFLQQSFNVIDVDVLPGTKDIIVLSAGGILDTLLNQMVSLSQVVRIDPFAPDSQTVIFSQQAIYTHMALLPDTSAVFNEYVLDTRAITLVQGDLMTNAILHTKIFPVTHAEEYVKDLAFDPSDSTMVLTGWGLGGDGCAYQTTFPAVYDTMVPYYRAIAAKVWFPMEEFPEPIVVEPTGITEHIVKNMVPTLLESNTSVTLFDGAIGDIELYAMDGKLVSRTLHATGLVTPATPGMYALRVTTDGGTHSQKIFVK
jgi:hypothetical protein